MAEGRLLLSGRVLQMAGSLVEVPSGSWAEVPSGSLEELVVFSIVIL